MTYGDAAADQHGCFASTHVHSTFAKLALNLLGCRNSFTWNWNRATIPAWYATLHTGALCTRGLGISSRASPLGETSLSLFPRGSSSPSSVIPVDSYTRAIYQNRDAATREPPKPRWSLVFIQLLNYFLALLWISLIFRSRKVAGILRATNVAK